MGKITINLSSKQGNAFYLIKVAEDLGNRKGLSEEEIKKITSDMRSLNFKHLMKVFEDNFGDLVEFTGDRKDYEEHKKVINKEI